MRLYHGTSAEFDERAEALITPAWFTEKPRTARWFVNWHGEPEALPYGKKLASTARIIEFRVASPIRLLLIPDKPTIDEIRDEYLGGAWDTESLSDWVCQQGYDGWFIPNNYPDEMAADIMLCSTDGLQYVNTEPVEESGSYRVANRIDEISGTGGWPEGPTPPIGPGRDRMKWQPGQAAPVQKNPRFNMPGPAEKPQLTYMKPVDLDTILDQIKSEMDLPPHKKNAARINALKQQAQEIARRLESQWVQQNADAMLPRLDEDQAGDD